MTIPDLSRAKSGADWRDGLFAGNGSHGVLAYAPAHLEWVVNKNDLFDGRVPPSKFLTHAEVMRRVAERTPKNSRFLNEVETHDAMSSDRTISAAILRVRFWRGFGWNTPAAPQVSERLSPGEGEIVQCVEAPFLHVSALTVVPHGPDIVAIRIACEPGCRPPLVIDLVRPEDERLTDAPAWCGDDGVLSFSQRLPNGRAYAVALLAVASGADGNDAAKAHPELGRLHGRIRREGAADLFVAVRTSRACADSVRAAREAVAEAAGRSFDALRAANRDWWRAFWSKGDARFDSEPDMDARWHQALYAIGASFGPAPMPGLNGLSYGPLDAVDSGVGSQGYTHDQNVQIPLLPFAPLGRAEFVATLADTYLDVLGRLREQTRERVGTDGVYLPLNMTQDGDEIPVGAYRYTLCGSAYSGLVLALAWRHSRDMALLRDKIYPLLAEFVSFYFGLLRRGADGLFHLDWSIPPEIFTLTRDDTATLSMLRVCLETVVEASALLGLDQTLRDRCADVLSHYPALARRPDGAWWGGPDIPLDHYCYGGHQLYPFFPSGAYPDPAAARATLAYIDTSAVEISHTTPRPHAMHEWSAFLTTAARLRLGDREAGWQGILDFAEGFGKPNGLFSHNPVWLLDAAEAERRGTAAPPLRLRSWDGEIRPFARIGDDVTDNPAARRLTPPVLEGSGAFAFLGAEALLQTQDGTPRAFAGVPRGFTGSFRGFRGADGSFVSGEMEDGRLVRLESRPAD